ncbi:MAG TPA: GntR family transcriptional regulator [Stellaceae bacterium]|nr:GntR family transcriptional regulator [Stellaceae bacterium]
MAVMSNVVRATLSEQVHQELRSRILGGQLPGGHRLLPEELANDLAISQTPVKEALLRLEADGLVVSGLRKGAVVRRFTLKDVEDLYEARIFVELASLEAAFARGAVTAALLDELSENLERHSFHLGRDTMQDLTTALAFDRAFHQRLVEARDNAVIAGWHQRILAQTHTAYVYLVNDTSRVYGEHRDILDALKAGTVTAARDALERHLRRSGQALLANIRQAQKNEGAS